MREKTTNTETSLFNQMAPVIIATIANSMSNQELGQLARTCRLLHTHTQPLIKQRWALSLIYSGYFRVNKGDMGNLCVSGDKLLFIGHKSIDVGLNLSSVNILSLSDLASQPTVFTKDYNIHSLVTAGNIIAYSCHSENAIKVYDANTGEFRNYLFLPEKNPDLAISGTTLASVALGDVSFWDLRTYNLLRTIKIKRIINSLAISENILVIGCCEGIVKIYDLNTDKCLNTIKYVGEAPVVAVSGTTLVIGNYEGDISIWNLCTGRCLRTLIIGHNILSLVFSGNMILCETTGAISIFQPDTTAAGTGKHLCNNLTNHTFKDNPLFKPELLSGE